MRTWGAKLYQDDLALDIKDEYKSLLEKGKTNEKAIKEMLETFEEEIEDEDEGPIFWLVFADVLWNYGRLTEEIKKKAIEEIESGRDLVKWEQEAKEYEQRRKELEKLKEKLNTQMPKEKKIHVKNSENVKKQKDEIINKEYDWKIGDTYAYKIEKDITDDINLIGKYLIFRKVDDYEKNKIYESPIVYIQITENNKLPTTREELEKLDYLVTSNWGNVQHEYRIVLKNVPKKKKVERLIYIGNYLNVNTPKDEYIETQKVSIKWCFYNKINYIIEYVIPLGTDKQPVYYETDPRNISDSYVRFLMRAKYYEKALKIQTKEGAIVKEDPLLYIALVDSMMIGGFVRNRVGIVNEEMKEETYKRIEQLKKIINSSKDEGKEERIKILEEFREKVKNYKFSIWN